MYSGVRPFGVSLLVVGWDDKGPQLFQVDPSGAYFEWKASALGKGMIQTKTFLEKIYDENMSLDDAIQNTIKALKESFDGQLTSVNLEIGVVREDKKFVILSDNQIKDYLEAE